MRQTGGVFNHDARGRLPRALWGRLMHTLCGFQAPAPPSCSPCCRAPSHLLTVPPPQGVLARRTCTGQQHLISGMILLPYFVTYLHW